MITRDQRKATIRAIDIFQELPMHDPTIEICWILLCIIIHNVSNIPLERITLDNLKQIRFLIAHLPVVEDN